MTVYKSFPKAHLIRNLAELLEMDRDDVVNLLEEWKTIHQDNERINTEMFTKKKKEVEELAQHLKDKGIDVYKYKRVRGLPARNGFIAWFKNNVADPIAKKYPSYSGGVPTAHMGSFEVNGIELYNNQSPTSLVELYDRMKWRYNLELKEKNKNNQLLIKSVEYASKHDVDIEDLSTEKIIKVVLEAAKDKYLEENVPKGTEVYLKHECDDCSAYFMGERRCSCGNRRISIAIEGDLIEGFYHYPEPY